MPSSMLVHDTRLAGTAPAVAPNTFLVGAGTQLTQALGWMSHYARANRRLSRLSIMCHGYESGVHDTRAGLSTTDLGFGLQFCKEGLTLANVSLTGVLDGLVDLIILYSCGPARTRPGFANSVGDGRRFCSELAGWTNAEVIAAVETQYYDKVPPASFLRRLFRVGAQDVINFGGWEGKVYRFYPDGTVESAGCPPQ